MDRIEWENFEYEYKHKTADWYWAVGIITVSIAVASILYGNIIFAILLIVGAFTLCLHAARQPHLIHFELNHEGVLVGKLLYPYSTIESFWVEDRDGDPRILLKSRKIFMPYIIVPLGAVMPETAHAYLSQYLPEEEHHEPLLQKVMEYLGF
jgi:hypothetical protein